MRKPLLAMSSSVALGVAVAASGAMPAGAIQLLQGGGPSVDAQVIQIQDRGRGGGDGPRIGGRSGGGGGLNIQRGGDRGPSIRGGFQGRQSVQGGFEGRRSMQGRFEARGRADFQARGQVQERRDVRRDFQRRDFDARIQSRRDFQRRDFDARIQSRRDGDWHRHDGRPRIVHRGWSRDHRHRFFGAVLIGVPFGYAAIATHPCYDWVYGPQGWGYYWNYDHCPV